ncbi:hypothetical protein BH10CHL1_BH10CHL1_05210 [soil metagenome]
MKILGRIVIILTAALMVVGIAIGLSQASYLQNITPNRGEFVPQTTTSVTSDSTVALAQSPNSGAPNGGFAQEGHNSASLFGIIQNLLIVGLIVLPFALAPRFMRGRQSAGSGGQPPSGLSGLQV